MGTIQVPKIGKQSVPSCSRVGAVVACPFRGAFEFADESAGYKTALRLMTLGVRFQIRNRTQNLHTYLVAAKGPH